MIWLFKNKTEWRVIVKCILGSHTLARWFSRQQCFYIWRCLSGFWRKVECGWSFRFLPGCGFSCPLCWLGAGQRSSRPGQFCSQMWRDRFERRGQKRGGLQSIWCTLQDEVAKPKGACFKGGGGQGLFADVKGRGWKKGVVFNSTLQDIVEHPKVHVLGGVVCHLCLVTADLAVWWTDLEWNAIFDYIVPIPWSVPDSFSSCCHNAEVWQMAPACLAFTGFSGYSVVLSRTDQ